MKKLLASILAFAMILCSANTVIFAEDVAAEETTGYVASVGEEFFTNIDDAIAAWLPNTTLTLLADVQLNDVIALDNKYARTLDLGTYTMTAKSRTSAIKLEPSGDVKSGTPRAYFTVNADAENPGGISASGASCIESVGNNKWLCILEIVINGGVFSGSYSIKHSNSMEQSAPWLTINGGEFKSQVWTDKAKVHVKGGLFSAKPTFKGTETGAYTVISGGRFSTMPFFTEKANALAFGTNPANRSQFDADVYMDDEGYICVEPTISEKPGDFEAFVTGDVYASALKYSNVNTEGKLYYTDADVCLAKNISKKGVTLLAPASENIKPTNNLFTVDCTNENASYSGDVVLSSTSRTFTIKLTDPAAFTGEVTTTVAGYKVIKTETVADGIITWYYSLVPQTVSADIADAADGITASAEVYSTYGEIDIPVTVDVSLPETAFDASDATEITMQITTSKPEDTSATFLGEEALVYDIIFVDENGNTVEFEGKATVKISYAGDAPYTQKVFFIADDGSFTDMNAVYDEAENAFIFETTHFSKYAIASASILEGNVATNVSIRYKATEDPNVYGIYAVAEEGKHINRFSSTQLQFELIEDTSDKSGMAYTLTPAEDLKMTGPDEDGYMLFHYKGTPADSKVASEILIATVTFEGYGKFVFSTIDSANKAMLHTATILDNIVVDYDAAATKGYDLILTEAGINDENAFGSDDFGGVINGEFTVPTSDLIINIDFPNAVENKIAAYQNMKVTVTGEDIKDIVFDLGSDMVKPAVNQDNKSGEVYDAEFVNGGYVITIKNALTQNTAYDIKVEGAGYRTARYTVNTQETASKTVNFWNNVKDADADVEAGKFQAKKNFLAGDIVKDNNINVYDLSAVVSYFGETGLVGTNNAYAKYDLNRDGFIDSKDVAMVLVSWNN